MSRPTEQKPLGSEGVILVAHGTIANVSELPEFLTRIRRGRPPSAELLAEMTRRYETIGGSPLLERTRLQAAALSRRLDAPVLVAMRLSKPSMEEALWGATELGLSRVVVIAMAPFSAHVYFAAAEASRATVEQRGKSVPRLLDGGPWGQQPALIQAQAARIRSALAGITPRPAVVLTAHSLPTVVLRSGDPYQTLFESFARAVERELGFDCAIAYQSQGADGGEWLGPELLVTLKQQKEKGIERVLVAPIGFFAEHVETLYDLDHETRQFCERIGLGFSRVPALDDDPGLIDALEAVTRRAFAQEGST